MLVTVSNEDELYEVLEPYLSGEELVICQCNCNEYEQWCDCEPSQLFNREILKNGLPYKSFTWYESINIEYPCTITILE
jgi:hypothetical protein